MTYVLLLECCHARVTAMFAADNVAITLVLLPPALQADTSCMSSTDIIKLAEEMTTFPTHFQTVTIAVKRPKTAPAPSSSANSRKGGAYGDDDDRYNGAPKLPTRGAHDALVGGLCAVLKANVVRDMHVGVTLLPPGMAELGRALSENSSLLRLSLAGSCCGDDGLMVRR